MNKWVGLRSLEIPLFGMKCPEDEKILVDMYVVSELC